MKIYRPTILVMFLLLAFSTKIWIPLNYPYLNLMKKLPEALEIVWLVADVMEGCCLLHHLVYQELSVDSESVSLFLVLLVLLPLLFI